MDTVRIARVKQAMQREKLDVLVCRLPENVLPLSGHWPMLGWSFMVFPLESGPLCVIPQCNENEAQTELWEADTVAYAFGVLSARNPYEDIAQALTKASAGRNWKHVGYEGNFESVAPSWNAAEHAIPAATTLNRLAEVFGRETLVDVTDFLQSQRSRKTPHELDRLRRVNEIAGFGMKTFHENAVPGISGVELVARVE